MRPGWLKGLVRLDRCRPVVSQATAASGRSRIWNPTEFEHLVFDMLSLRGLSNVDWRTPGADGGRDIEGLWTQFDLSGYEQRTKWFVECKRYAAAVDWPTIYEKVAYADSHQADVLLMCTSSSFSPAALTRVAEWNDRRRRPTIRLWPQHELHLRLQQHPDLLANTACLTRPQRQESRCCRSLSRCQRPSAVTIHDWCLAARQRI